MKIKQSLWTAAAILALTSGVNAALITWVDRNPNSGNGPIQKIRVSSSYTFFFDITTVDAGPTPFVPGTHMATTIDVKFAFADDRSWDGAEVVAFSLGGINIPSLSRDVDGNHSDAPNSYDWVSGSLSGNFTLLGDLNHDGKLAYTVSVTTGDTYLKIAEFKATGDQKPRTIGIPVPDGGATFGLFGLGLLGLGAIRRKLRQN